MRQYDMFIMLCEYWVSNSLQLHTFLRFYMFLYKHIKQMHSSQKRNPNDQETQICFNSKINMI